MVKQGQEIGLQNMGPGIHAAKPDEEIRKVISKYEEYYYSGIGHGVGLDFKSRSLATMVQRSCSLFV